MVDDETCSSLRKPKAIIVMSGKCSSLFCLANHYSVIYVAVNIYQ